MQPSEANWQAFYADVLRLSKLDLSQYKAGQLQRRVVSMADSKGCGSLKQFAVTLQEPQQLRWFMDKLAINVSEMFRNPERWDEVEKKVVPELLERARSLKVWSAGCSIGAEAYTMAMILDRAGGGPHRVIGTDIDLDALAQAKRAEYRDADVRAVPDAFKRRYLKQSDGVWSVDPKIRSGVSFQRQDLLRDRPPNGFDLILCRNVVIYFNDDAKAALYQRFVEALKPGGFLFVGSTERVFDADSIGLKTAWPFFYRKVNQGD